MEPYFNGVCVRLYPPVIVSQCSSVKVSMWTRGSPWRKCCRGWPAVHLTWACFCCIRHTGQTGLAGINKKTKKKTRTLRDSQSCTLPTFQDHWGTHFSVIFPFIWNDFCMAEQGFNVFHIDDIQYFGYLQVPRTHPLEPIHQFLQPSMKGWLLGSRLIRGIYSSVGAQADVVGSAY